MTETMTGPEDNLSSETAAAPVPTPRRFDLRADAAVFLPEQLLPQGRVHQQIAYDQAHGWMYVTQIISGGRQLADEPAPVDGALRDQHGDLCISRLTMSGTVLGSMYVRGSGHGWSLSAEPVGADTWLWTETAAARDGTYGWGTKVGRFKWVKDAILDSGDPEIEVFDPLPGGRRVCASIDWLTERVFVLYKRAEPDDGNQYNVYSLPEFRARQFTVRASFPQTGTASLTSAPQNFVAFGQYIYQMEGSAYSATNPPPGNSYFSMLSATNGRLLDRVFNDNATDLSHREAESMSLYYDQGEPRLVFGFGTREPGPRRIVLMSLPLFPPEPKQELPAPPAPENLLGCAEQYSAAFHLRGGERVYLPAAVVADSLTDVQWERRLNETSTARIVIAKQNLVAECCALLGTIEPWCHELSIYRDEELVWQGPVLRVNEEQNTITVDARDISAWLAKLVNMTATNYPRGRDVALIAQDVIVGNLNLAKMAHPELDWPNLLPYLWRLNARVIYKLNRAGSIWTDTVMTILQDMADRGFEWSAIGRRLVMRPEKQEAKDRARARLVPEHLPGGISVVKDGEDAATVVFATSQTDSDPGVTVSVAIPAAKRQTSCGRLDMLVRHNPRIEVETSRQEQGRHDVIKLKYDFKEMAERASANRDLDKIFDGPDTPEEKKAAERRRNLRDMRISQFRREEAAEIRASDARIAAIEKALTVESLQQLARKTLNGRWPVPTVIVVKNDAKLSPDAPLTVEDLVPGERIDVAALGFCREVTQAMKLTQVRGQWNQNGESIGISLTPLTELIAEDI